MALFTAIIPHSKWGFLTLKEPGSGSQELFYTFKITINHYNVKSQRNIQKVWSADPGRNGNSGECGRYYRNIKIHGRSSKSTGGLAAGTKGGPATEPVI